MSIYQDYYSGLSSDDKSDGDDDSIDSNDGNSSSLFYNTGIHASRVRSFPTAQQDPVWGKTILHIDIDCFYVQCEEIDRGLKENGKSCSIPLAIGQKHIVVTCNYVARSLGITKLMSKITAMKKCPSLRIVDGSDLRNYKKHSQRIYQAFREVVQTEVGLLVANLGSNKHAPSVSSPCKKNAMDEMMADISTAVNALVAHMESLNHHDGGEEHLINLLSTTRQQNQDEPKTFVFGETAASSIAEITEDQSGATSRIVSTNNSPGDRMLASSRRNVHQNHHGSKRSCSKRLRVAMLLAKTICQRIATKTGFTVSAGLSVNPLLSKLSVISKPKTVNLLLPWRSPQILYSMPLRKVNEIGSRTHRAISQMIHGSSGGNSKQMITVQDLLKLPREQIVEALLTMVQFEQRSSGAVRDRALCEEKCDALLDRCRGLDPTIVQDDGGGMSKTVSVENSYRRGTITTRDATRTAFDELCTRLPPLVMDRVAWSKTPEMAYPTTLRLTMREINPLATQRSSRSITRSKQVGVSTQWGKILSGSSPTALSNTEREAKATQMLQQLAIPLLRHLLSQRDNSTSLNITRMNLALANFQDAVVQDMSHPSSSASRFSTTLTGKKEVQRNSPCNAVSRTPQNKKTNNAVPATPLSVATGKRKPQPSSGSSRKFSRTRIDQFFAKKPSR